MKNDKILVRINNINDINEYKKIGITNFLFAMEKFSIGYPTFNLDELKNIEGNIYLLFNRILDSQALQLLKKIIPNLNNIRGIFFEDVGIYQMLKDTDIPLIWDQSHFVINQQSINYWLELVKSANLSNELTLEEIQNILNNAKKALILPVFGKNMIMYSRRHLLSYYNEYFNLDNKKERLLRLPNNIEFTAKESDYGTVYFYNKYFNYIPYLNKVADDKVLLYYINPVELNVEDTINIINGIYPSSEEKFLHEETIYKLEAKND